MNVPDRRLQDAQRWLRYAVEDLRNGALVAAEPDGTPRNICLFAQQAAEKSLEGVLVFLSKEVPRSHDLSALAEPVQNMGPMPEIAKCHLTPIRKTSRATAMTSSST